MLFTARWQYNFFSDWIIAETGYKSRKNKKKHYQPLSPFTHVHPYPSSLSYSPLRFPFPATLTTWSLMYQVSLAAGLEGADVQLILTMSPGWQRSLAPCTIGLSCGISEGDERGRNYSCRLLKRKNIVVKILIRYFHYTSFRIDVVWEQRGSCGFPTVTF